MHKAFLNHAVLWTGAWVTLAACDLTQTSSPATETTDETPNVEPAPDTPTTPSGPTVADVQTGAIVLEDLVTIQGAVVTSPDAGYGFFIQDQTGTENAGIWVSYSDVLPWDDTGAGVLPGHEVTITAIYLEQNGLSTLEILNTTDLEITNAVPIPAPIVLSETQFADPDGLERYEGMLVTVQNLTVTEDRGNGEWAWGTGVTTGDMFFDLSAIRGAVRGSADAITGNLHYSFGAFKLQPHSAESFSNYRNP